MIKIIEECDYEIKLKNINVIYSGSTGVVVVMKSGMLYAGSVGDSRAVIGTISLPAVLPAPFATLGEERKVLEDVRVRRGSRSDRLVQPVQLTKDQKPDDPEELVRITKSGGHVQRLRDDSGNRIGPYRVWEANSNTPGIAMSRSIGDLIAKKIGVISTPICTTHILNTDSDLFIVIASDGVWDVMENEEIVNFIECFREKCKHGNLKKNGTGEIITTDNACIAQLICEEARIRWYSIVEDEDVSIDDISCIVLEFKKGEIPIQFNKTKTNLFKEPEVEPIEFNNEHTDVKRAPATTDIITRDPRRGSVVTDKII